MRTFGPGSFDAIRQRFTGKERDTESGLDYFGARYFSGPQGRFSSLDPSLKSANVDRPQTWNRYVYAYNTPLRYVDPDGNWPTTIHGYGCNLAFADGHVEHWHWLELSTGQIHRYLTATPNSRDLKRMQAAVATPEQ